MIIDIRDSLDFEDVVYKRAYTIGVQSTYCIVVEIRPVPYGNMPYQYRGGSIASKWSLY